MEHRLTAYLFRFYTKHKLHTEVNKESKMKAILNIATVNKFPITMIQHRDTQIKSGWAGGGGEAGHPPKTWGKTMQTVLFCTVKDHQFKNK
jgi:hypothetical protein